MPCPDALILRNSVAICPFLTASERERAFDNRPRGSSLSPLRSLQRGFPAVLSAKLVSISNPSYPLATLRDVTLATEDVAPQTPSRPLLLLQPLRSLAPATTRNMQIRHVLQ
jgi:hypothetical protein